MIENNATLPSIVSKISAKTDNKTLFMLIGITLLASLLRFYKLGTRDFWFDEAYSVMDVRSILLLPSNTGANTLAYAIEERLPPFFFFLLVPFYLLSPSESVLRIVSVVPGIASIPIMYLLGAKLFSRKLGLIGALFLSLSPFAIYYSQELRPYSLFLLFSILAFYLSLLTLEKGKKSHFLGLLVTLVLGFYTHYFMIFTILIIELYYVLSWRTSYPLLKKWVFTHLGVVVLCIPGLFHILIHISTGNTNLVDFPPGLRSLAGTFYLYTMGRVFLPSREHLFLIMVQCLLWAGGLVIGIFALRKSKGKNPNTHTTSLFLASGFIYCLIWFVSLTLVPLFDEARIHYLIFLLPIYILLTVEGWVYFRNTKIGYVLVGLALVLNLVSLYPYYFAWDQVGKGSFRTAAEYVESNLQENDVIYHTTHQSYVPFEYYLNWEVPQVDLLAATDSDYKNNDRFWLVVSEHQGGLDFSLDSLGLKNLSLSSQVDFGTTCQKVISDPKYDLVEYEIYPGKTALMVCLYQRTGQW